MLSPSSTDSVNGPSENTGEPLMEKLVYLAYATIPFLGVVCGFLGGAVANLFGFPFWPSALLIGSAVAIFQTGRIVGALRS